MAWDGRGSRQMKDALECELQLVPLGPAHGWNPSSAPLVMWLSGGPGCSSQLALFAENGPCHLDLYGLRQFTYKNPASWHYAANVMWVDQPAGVGFSTGIGTHNEQGVANNMFVFLQKFFAAFPQYQSTNFYIFGESYAGVLWSGHYVPAISHRIWSGNKAAWTTKLDWAHGADFRSASDEDWKMDGRTAGHMVPMDQPKVALQMMSDFAAWIQIGTGP
eukprot:Skav217271  [mRNA]  locus=scaffold120:48756:62856:- [translate_table: standard]